MNLNEVLLCNSQLQQATCKQYLLNTLEKHPEGKGYGKQLEVSSPILLSNTPVDAHEDLE